MQTKWTRDYGKLSDENKSNQKNNNLSTRIITNGTIYNLEKGERNKRDRSRVDQENKNLIINPERLNDLLFSSKGKRERENITACLFTVFGDTKSKHEQCKAIACSVLMQFFWIN